jgi:hypothetical protein
MRMTQLTERHGLDLPNALAGDAKLDTDFFQGAIFAVFQASAAE